MFSYKIIPYTLHFLFDAGTSRGILKEKKSWFIRLSHSEYPEKIGWGECGLLPGLSPENPDTFESDLEEISRFLIHKLETKTKRWENLSARWMEDWNGDWLPAAWFGWETAWLDWVNGGKGLICDPAFHSGLWKVTLNGLVWMNPANKMWDQAIEKRQQGFETIKLKIGALDWLEELDMISKIRAQMPVSEIKIRLDVNGAWKPAEARKKLEQLAMFDIESIEQPIAVNQWPEMADLCKHSPIPIALDEELTAKPHDSQKFQMLETIEPQYIVIKPSLVGGLGQSHQWIKMAEDFGIEWWITSMLESNIGLNAIAQLSSQYLPTLAQGLGTGQIYKNNFESPLAVENGEIQYHQSKKWDYTLLG